MYSLTSDGKIENRYYENLSGQDEETERCLEKLHGRMTDWKHIGGYCIEDTG